MSDLVAELGIASARIYAAFGSKEELFREAVELYESNEGAFAERAFSESRDARSALEQMFRSAIALYTAGKKGCMVVSAAVSCSDDSAPIWQWLSRHRSARTQFIIERLSEAQAGGEIAGSVDISALGDFCSIFLNGLSVQAKDGVGTRRLEMALDSFLAAYDSIVSGQ